MKFNHYKYIPTIRTRASELLAIENLTNDTKEKILPFVGLSKAGRISKIDSVFEKWIQSFNKPAIIGLAEHSHLHVDEYHHLISNEDGFSNWEKFILDKKKSHEKIIPSIIYNKDVGKRDFVQQIQKFESLFGKIVLKINPLIRRDLSAATAAASIINDTSNILFILDVGQISREQQKAALDATINSINELRSIDPTIELVTTSTSFPRMFKSYTKDRNESYGEIPMLEWENYHALGGENIAIYGDYASIHGEFYEGSYAKFVARIDYPAPATWFFERRKSSEDENRDKLYSEAAKAIITNESWDDSLNVWGSETIRLASNNELKKFGSPGKWISVRMNLHIERIIRFLEDGISVPLSTIDDWDENVWEDDDWEN